MTYNEYLDLVAKDLTYLDPHMLPISPPEMLYLVAREMFVSETMDTPLAVETRARLKALRTDGKTGFDSSPSDSPGGSTKPRRGTSEFA